MGRAIRKVGPSCFACIVRVYFACNFAYNFALAAPQQDYGYMIAGEVQIWRAHSVQCPAISYISIYDICMSLGNISIFYTVPCMFRSGYDIANQERERDLLRVGHNLLDHRVF